MAPPSVPANPSPGNGVTVASSSVPPPITWTAPGATSCVVYFGPGPYVPGKHGSYLSFTSHWPGGLATRSGIGLESGGVFTYSVNDGLRPPEGMRPTTPSLTLYWQVFAINAEGITPGPVWKFTLGPPMPGAPALPSPSDAGTAGLNPVLTWNAADATSYDVYFGTSDPPPLVSSDQSASSYVPAGPLIDTTTYFWQIVARNVSGSATGAVWSFTADAAVQEDSVITLTTTSTGTQNDFSPGTLGNLTILRCNNASLLTIQGLANGVDGQLLWIESVGAGQVDLANQHASSAAANRLINNVTGPISLAAGSGRALLHYDGTTARWRVLQHEQGAFINQSYSAGDFTNAAGSWTVDAGDLSVFAYRLSGRQLTIKFTIFNSSVVTTGGSALSIAIPGVWNAAAAGITYESVVIQHNGTSYLGTATWVSGGLISLSIHGANWTNSTNGTNIAGTIIVEVG
jgi:hypothetical protein